MRSGVATAASVLFMLFGAVPPLVLAAPISIRLSVPDVIGGITPPGGTLQQFSAPSVTFHIEGDTERVAAAWPGAVQLFGPIRVTIPGVAAGTVLTGAPYVYAQDSATTGVVTFVLSRSGFFSQSAGGHSPALFGYRLNRSTGPLSVSSWTQNTVGGGAGISFVADDGSIVGLRAGGQGTLDVSVADPIPVMAPIGLAVLVGLVGVVGAFAAHFSRTAAW